MHLDSDRSILGDKKQLKTPGRIDTAKKFYRVSRGKRHFNFISYLPAGMLKIPASVKYLTILSRRCGGAVFTSGSLFFGKRWSQNRQCTTYKFFIGGSLRNTNYQSIWRQITKTCIRFKIRKVKNKTWIY